LRRKTDHGAHPNRESSVPPSDHGLERRPHATAIDESHGRRRTAARPKKTGSIINLVGSHQTVIAEPSQASALVTGATGFIGGRFVERLVDDGWSVKVLVTDPSKLAPAVNRACAVIAADSGGEEALCRAVRRTDVVFHFAANVSAWESWDSDYAVNVTGVEKLLKAIVKENCSLSRLVHLSTVDVYGFPTAPCDELCKTTGNGFPYGETKLHGEALVREYGGAYNLRYTILRPTNVIGPGSQFISRIGDELKSGIMLTIDGGKTNAGMLYVDNLIGYMIWASHAANAIDQCNNVRDSYDVGSSEFIGKFRPAIGANGLVIDMPFALVDALAWGFELFNRTFLPSREPILHRLLVRLLGRTCGHNAEKIRSDSGQLGSVGFDQAMERSISWFLERKSTATLVSRLR